MVVRDFALVADPASGLKIELGGCDDSEVHFRDLGFRAEPHRRDFARMYTSFLTQRGGLEVQLVDDD